MQLLCGKHAPLCATVLGAPPGQAAEATATICRTFVGRALQCALQVARTQQHSAAVGLELTPTSGVIVELLQGATGMLHQLFRSSAAGGEAPVSASFAGTVVATSLRIAAAVYESPTLVVRWLSCHIDRLRCSIVSST